MDLRQASRRRAGPRSGSRDPAAPSPAVLAAFLALAIPLTSCGEIDFPDPTEPAEGTHPDLTVEGVATSRGEVFRGAVLDVTVTVRNAGDAPAPSGWDWTLGLSPAPGFDPNAEIASGTWNVALAPDATSSLDVAARIPPSVPADSYHLVVTLDPSGSLDGEKDVTNNTGSSAGAVAVRIPYPDLAVESVTAAPSIVAPGDSVQAVLEVVNSGRAAAPRDWRWALYLSGDDALDGGDRELASGTWSDSLDVGQVGARTVESRIPADLPSGDYRVLAELDGANDVDEGDGEANNAGASASVVTVSSPPESGLCRIPAVPDPSEVDLSADRTYAVMGGQPVRLDVASPPGASGRPMVLALHGGSWRAGDKSARRNLILRLANAGYVAASANYRLANAPENTFPAAVADVRCAVRWMKANATSLGGDAGRVVAVGTSAGGHLASMLAVAPEVSALDGAGHCEIAGDPSVRGAASFYGVYDLRADAPGIVDSTEIGSVVNFLGGHPEDVPGLAAAASPVVHLDGGDPPFLLSFGRRDQRAFRLQGQTFAESLALRGVSAELVTVDAGHGYRPLSDDPDLEASSCALLDYLDDVLGQP